MTKLDEAFASDFVRRGHEAVNAHDADGIAELCAPDVEWHDPAVVQPLGGVTRCARSIGLGCSVASRRPFRVHPRAVPGARSKQH